MNNVLRKLVFIMLQLFLNLKLHSDLKICYLKHQIVIADKESNWLFEAS